DQHRCLARLRRRRSCRWECSSRTRVAARYAASTDRARHPPVGAYEVQRGHEVDIPATAPMNRLTSATMVLRRSAALKAADLATSARWLAPLAAYRASTPPSVC